MSGELIDSELAKLFSKFDKAIKEFNEMSRVQRAANAFAVRSILDPLLVLILPFVGVSSDADAHMRPLLPIFMEMSMYGMVSKRLVRRLINKLYKAKLIEEDKQRLLEGGDSE